MAITYVSAYVFIACLFFAGCVQSQNSYFDSFTKDVQSALPTGDFLKLFKLDNDGIDQVVQALKKAGKTFADTLDTSIPENIAEKFTDRAKEISKLTQGQLFLANVRALAGTLGDQGILYSGNENELVNSYVDELKEAAKSVESGNILDTLPATSTAIAKVLKSQGLAGLQLIVINFANNLLQEIDSVGKQS